MPYVFAFDHKHRRPPMEMKDLLGGKGANLAEMTSVLRAARSARASPSPPTPAGRTCTAAGRPGSMPRSTSRCRRSSARWAGKLGDPHDPLLVSVRSGAKFSMPGMMDTVLNLGLNDRSVKGLAKVTADERFAYDSYRRFIAMYGRIVLGLDGEPFERGARGGQGATPASRPTPTSRPTGLKELCELYKAIVKAEYRPAVPAGPAPRSSGARSRRCSRAGTAPGPSPTGCGSASATTWARRSTSRRWCSATVTTTRAPAWASPATPPPARTGPTATSWSTPRARTWWPASGTPRTSTRWRGSSPTIHAELLAIFARLEQHYRDMCDTEFTIEQGKLWMLQTRVGKRTGAAALRMAVDMTRGPAGARTAGRSPGAKPCMRITGDHLDQVLHPHFAGKATAIAKGLARVAGRGRRQGVLHRRRRRRRRRPGRAGHPRAQRDQPRGRPRDDGLRGHPHRPRRPGVARRGRGPRAGARPPWSAPRPSRSRASSSRVGDVVVKEGDVISLDGTTGEIILGELRLAAAEPPPEFQTILSWADDVRRGKLKVRANADNGPDAAQRPSASAPRASGCAGPSTCSSARTGCPSCGA